MKLLLVRHAPPENHGSENLRPLTPQGIDIATQAAQGLTKITDPPHTIYTSTKRRAAQTAEIIGQAFDRTPQPLEALAEESTHAILSHLNHEELSNKTVMLVGHEPTMGTLIGLLCLGHPISAAPFPKAGCACLQTPHPPEHAAGQAHLLWLLTPKILASLATP